LAQRGARVWACDLLADELEETRSVCGESCAARRVDVSDSEQVRAFVAEAERAAGQVHVLVNNAGGVLGQVGRPLETIAPAEWNAIFAVNVTGAFYCSQAVAPAMKRARQGRIVNISSRAGLEISLTGIQAYAAAKAAQIGLTRQLAHELGPWGITVNNVSPGFVRSNPTTERQWQSYGEEGQKRLVESIALKRLGAPEDIAHAVLFFASDYAGWITGQVLSVDGGK
jgi:3-oxoacyl-[acyl-carrier protein] reductase